jgi:hypothetical protein
MNIYKAEIRAVVLGKDGKIRKRYKWKRANSLIKAFAQGLKIGMGQAAETVKDVTGTDRTVGANAANLSVNAVSGVSSWGMVIGSDATPVSMSDYKLGAQITTNVDHSAVTVSMEYPDANTARVVISRTFTNNTGANVVIQEVGLYAKLGGTTYNFCIDRSLYSLLLPAGEAVVITYRISVSV